MGEVKERIVVAAGAALLASVGKYRFYDLAQTRQGIFGRLAAAFCQGHAARVSLNYAIFAADRNKARMTDAARRSYDTDDLHGFGAEDYSERGLGRPLLEQQRGLIIPRVEQAIREDRPSTVVEIGTGNGDSIAHLAAIFPDARFTGIDLSTRNAKAKHHGRNNLEFIEGYALDLLESGEARADLAYASSTFCIFAPDELRAYLRALGHAKRLLISEPVLPGFDQRPLGTGPLSRHMDSYMWWHDYPGYLAEAGWKVRSANIVDYSYPTKTAKVLLVDATQTAASPAHRVAATTGT